MRSGPHQNAEKACKRKNCQGKTGNGGHFACFGAFAEPCGNVKFSCKAANFATWRNFPGAFAKPCGNAKFSCKAANFATWRNFPGAFVKPCGIIKSSRGVSCTDSLRSCKIYLEIFPSLADVLIALAACWRCQHPETARAALPARRRHCRRTGGFSPESVSQRVRRTQSSQSGGCKKRFEPSLVCRFAGNAALLPGEQATPFSPFPGLAASKRRILRGILQTLPVTAFQAQARIYGGRLQKREIPAGY